MVRTTSGVILHAILSVFLCQNVVAATDALQEVNRRFHASEVLQTLSETIETGFATRHLVAQNCTCSHHACSNLLDPIVSCTERLGSLEHCGDGCSTRKVTLETGLVTTPPATDLNNLSPLIVEETCIYQKLNEAFVNFEDTIYSWIYFGTAGGLSIGYPGAPSDKGIKDGPSDPELGHCTQYDPRRRPWYVDATSAPKDLIILVDASSSMTGMVAPGTSRWDLAKEVAKTAIDLLHFSDAVRLVILGDNEYNDDSTPILIGSGEYNKERLKTALDTAKPSGKKRTLEGMRSAFRTFRFAQSNQISSTGCQQVILWITDGHFCRHANRRCVSEHEFLHNFIDALEKEQETLEPTNVHGKASIFVATVGNDVDTKLARHIACAHNGTWMHVERQPFLQIPDLGCRVCAAVDDRDIVEQLLPYCSFFAGQMKENKERIVWSRFYEDFSGLGAMTTGTRRIFAIGNHGSKRGRLLGVAGFDIPLSRLRENGLSYADVVGQLSLNIGQCNVHHIDACQLQLLREESGECPNVHPSSQCYHDEQSGRVYYLPGGPDQHYTFSEAEATCVGLNGQLPELSTRNQQSLLSSLTTFDGTWIALKKEPGTYSWTWLSGKDTEVETYPGFWAENYEMDHDATYCAAMDSRGTRLNVEARDCDDGLHLICEFESVKKAERACKGDIHLVESNAENRMPSLEYCLADVDNAEAMFDKDTFIRKRKIENRSPVFCPMDLGRNRSVDNAQAQCCATCLGSEFPTLASESNADTTSSSANRQGSKPFLLLLLLCQFLFLFILHIEITLF